MEFEFEWDEAKTAANIRKHGVSFDWLHPYSAILESLQSPIRNTVNRKNAGYPSDWRTMARYFR